MIRNEFLDQPAPCDLFLPQGPGPHPLICITPLLGRLELFEDLFFEKRIARFFASKGLAAAVIHRPIFEFDPRRGLEQLQEHMDQAIARNFKVLHALVVRPDIDPDRIGTFGMSFGAVINCLWAAIDPRLQAHVFALAGGNLPGIFVSSRDPLMRSYLSAALQISGGNVSSLERELQKNFQLDPLRTAGSIPKEKVLLILAVFDRVVRFRFGLQLKKALGHPATVFLPLGHYTSLLAIPFLKRQALGFFRKKFSVN